MGFFHDSTFHHRAFKKEEPYAQIPFSEASEIEGINLPKQYGASIPEKPEILFDRLDKFLSLKIIVPVFANFYNQSTEKSEPGLCGVVIAEDGGSDQYHCRSGERRQ
jgi:hypothetical protein